jgi:phenylacetate-CoA ligase
MFVTEGEDVRLKIVVELAAGADGGGVVERVVQKSILDALLRTNGEYNAYVPEGKQTPIVLLKAYGDKEFFPVGVKHKYIQD